MVELFLKSGVSPNHSITPLHVCARVGDLDTMELLIAHKANVNATNGDGDTALHFAACRGSGRVFFAAQLRQRPPLRGRLAGRGRERATAQHARGDGLLSLWR